LVEPRGCPNAVEAATGFAPSNGVPIEEMLGDDWPDDTEALVIVVIVIPLASRSTVWFLLLLQF
jgi:hypothetical protein